MPALQGELGGAGGGCSSPSPAAQPALFALPQDEVHEAAEQREGEGHPGQHVGVAEAAALHLNAAVGEAPVQLRAPVGVDGGPDHHAEAWRQEAEGSPLNDKTQTLSLQQEQSSTYDQNWDRNFCC